MKNLLIILALLIPSISLASVTPAEVIALTNTIRVISGQAVLKEDKALSAIAQQKADDMVARNYFSHIGPDGMNQSMRLITSGYGFTYAGENLAKDFSTSRDVVMGWVLSPTHRENVLRPQFNRVGVAVSGRYVVQLFTKK